MVATAAQSWPLDAESARLLADDRWLEDLSLPVPGWEYQRAVEILQASFAAKTATHRAAGEKGVELLHIAYHLPLLAAQYRLRRATIDRVDAAGGCLYRAGAVRDAASERSDLLSATLQGSNRQLAFRPRLASRLRLLAWHLRGTVGAVITDHRRVGSLWLAKQREIAALTTAESWVPYPVVPPAAPGEGHLTPAAEAIARDVLEDLCVLDTPLGQIEGAARGRFIDGMVDVLARLSAGLGAGARAARSQGARGRPLIVGGAGHMQSRLHAAAWRAAGGTTIATVHGNTFLTHYRPGTVSDGFLSLTDRYVTSTTGEAAAVTAALRDFDLGFPAPAVTPVGETFLAAWRGTLADGPRRPDGKHVAIMGHPLNMLYYPNVAGQNSAAYLALEHDLGRLLRQAGYRVTYKAHPETSRHLSSEFSAAFDAVETAPIENTRGTFDQLLFPHPFTTSFGFAMLTDRPIVLMLDRSLPRRDEDFALLAARCQVVWSAQDERGRVRFERDMVLSALEDAPHFSPLPADALR